MTTKKVCTGRHASTAWGVVVKCAGSVRSTVTDAQDRGTKKFTERRKAMAVEFTAINAGAEIMTGGGSSQGKNSPEIAGNTGVLCSPRSVTQGIKKPRRALVGLSLIHI